MQFRSPQSAIMNTYGRLPVNFVRGEGIWLYDENNKPYLDAISSIAVCGLGHNHPKINQAIIDQLLKISYSSNIYQNEIQEELAQTLCAISGLEKAFFCNSGAEANETAIKLARLHGHNKRIDCPTIIVMNNALHGRTLATLTATGQREVQAGFEPLVSGFVRAPFNDAQALKQIIKNNHNIVAIMLEPIQAEAGITLPSSTYLKEIQSICKGMDLLLILDEVQTGNGRTGSYFNFEQHSLKPDIVTTAKGLANGLPIGACLATNRVANLMQPGSHGSTFGGNPLACRAALTVIEALHTEGLMKQAQETGDYILTTLKNQLEGAEYIKEVRGQGLMIGIELMHPCPELVTLAKAKGLLINLTGNNKVIRLLPPLILNLQQASNLCRLLVQLIKVYMSDERSNPRTKMH